MSQSTPSTGSRNVFNILRWPLYLRVLLGVVSGAVLGFVFQNDPILFGWTNRESGQLASLYVQLLTALATPLVFFAILDAFVQTSITGRQGLKMFCICLFNIAIAFLIGLTILNLWEPGRAWSDKFAPVAQELSLEHPPASDTLKVPPAFSPDKSPSLSLMDYLRSHTLKSVIQPFSENTILTVAVLAICIGAALRSLRSGDQLPQSAIVTFEQLIVVSFQLVMKLLLWLIEFAPLAICLAVSGVVGESGWETFRMVGSFLLSVCAGLAIHSLIYYPLSSWLFAGLSPYVYFKEGGSAILTGFSLNSSLATSPLTLEALRKMGVSDSSARLSACVGTNFNNDGVTLYEAMTALFIAQAVGLDMTIAQQISILLAALVGSMGIAGIPNSGLIILALVLKAANLPPSAVDIGIPLVFSVDFAIARLRSAVNVMGDLQVAILLDAAEGQNRESRGETSTQADLSAVEDVRSLPDCQQAGSETDRSLMQTADRDE